MHRELRRDAIDRRVDLRVRQRELRRLQRRLGVFTFAWARLACASAACDLRPNRRALVSCPCACCTFAVAACCCSRDSRSRARACDTSASAASCAARAASTCAFEMSPFAPSSSARFAVESRLLRVRLGARDARLAPRVIAAPRRVDALARALHCALRGHAVRRARSPASPPHCASACCGLRARGLEIALRLRQLHLRRPRIDLRDQIAAVHGLVLDDVDVRPPAPRRAAATGTTSAATCASSVASFREVISA